MIKKIIDISDKILMSVIQEILKVCFYVLILYFSFNFIFDFSISDIVGLDCFPDCV
tara:strand:+ start:1189 stop:1356 length:168 start_codon:yes stop_codon:yes gene_type:complete